MLKNLRVYFVLPAVAVVGALALAVSAQAKDFPTPPDGTPAGNMGPTIYVYGQDLFYDSIVLTDLPMEGPFQQLEPGGPSGLMTEFGLGDQEYVGGRWWLDANMSGEMDEGDAFFMCPLLGPGREDL